MCTTLLPPPWAISPVVLDWMTKPVSPPPTPDEMVLKDVNTLGSPGSRSKWLIHIRAVRRLSVIFLRSFRIGLCLQQSLNHVLMVNCRDEFVMNSRGVPLTARE